MTPEPRRRVTREQAIRQARQDRIPRARRPWPFREDRTALDRARRLTHAFRDALAETSPDTAAAIVDQACQYGETWIRPSRPDHTAGRRLTAEDAGDLVGRQPKTVRSWTHRGALWATDGQRHFLTRHPDGYDERELLAFDAAMRGAPTTTEAA